MLNIPYLFSAIKFFDFFDMITFYRVGYKLRRKIVRFMEKLKTKKNLLRFADLRHDFTFGAQYCTGGTCLVPPDLYEFGPTKTCEIGPTGLLKNVLFSKTSEFGPTDFFLDPNLLPLSIY